MPHVVAIPDEHRAEAHIKLDDLGMRARFVTALRFYVRRRFVLGKYNTSVTQRILTCVTHFSQWDPRRLRESCKVGS